MSSIHICVLPRLEELSFSSRVLGAGLKNLIRSEGFAIEPAVVLIR